jgi:hypothetical protein
VSAPYGPGPASQPYHPGGYPSPQQDHAPQYAAPVSAQAPYPPQYAAPSQPIPQHPQYAPAPAPYPAAPPVPETQCRLCGCVPAAEVTFRGHRGMIVMMQFLHFKGPFCRDCGMATFRDMTAKTLIQGWYGYASFLITPITVLINLVRRGKVANLQAPRPPARGQYRQPRDPGPALLARPTALIGLAIPVVLFTLLVLVIAVNANGSS